MKRIATIVMALLLAGCSDYDWHAKDISGLMPPLEFEMVAEDGDRVTEYEYRDRIVAVYFGFTHCPDVCPTTLARWSGILRQLGEDAPVRVLFVTVDPARDTVETMRSYTSSFGERFIGLHPPDRQALDQLTRRYRVTYGYGDKDARGNYDVSHSSAVFVFDREGKARLLVRDSDDTAGVVEDMQRLIEKG